jgi:hypothetical protein
LFLYWGLLVVSWVLDAIHCDFRLSVLLQISVMAFSVTAG